jgi:hypothetical protein
VRGAKRWREVGEGLGPTDRRCTAGTSLAVGRSGRRRARVRGWRRDKGGWGSLTGGPHAILDGGMEESRTLMCGPCSTVRTTIELDSKKKFQIRLKSNGSNGFKFLHTLTASNRTLPCSKNLK